MTTQNDRQEAGHDRWQELLPAYLLGALESDERSGLERHLDGCPECAAELRWLRPAVEAIPADVEAADPPAGLKRAVMAAVEADIEAGSEPVPGSLAAPEPATGAGSLSEDAEKIRSWENSEKADQQPARTAGPGRTARRFWAGLRPVAFGLAVVALLAGLGGGYALRGGSDGGPGPAGVEPSPVVARSGEAPGTTAELVRRGDSGTITIANLERPPDGMVYQAWIQRGSQIKPTDSLFYPRDDGSAATGIPDLKGVNAVMVTAEPVGGSERPTSEPFIILSTPS